MSNASSIWNYFKNKGINNYGIAGIMGNLYAESGFLPNNLQNTYEKTLGMTDAQYTAAVDSGLYSKFITDNAGYGLAQWSYWSRKQGLFNLAKANKTSIGDLNTQLLYIYTELVTLDGFEDNIKNALSIQQASNFVLTKYEKSLNYTSSTTQNQRLQYSTQFYNEFSGDKVEVQPNVYQAVMIGHASIDERGKASGGQAGDQTGSEVCVRAWYQANWDVLIRPKDPSLGDKMATMCEWICNSNLVGYDQSQRNTLYTELSKLNWDYKKLSTKCETDCSAFMATCAKACGSNVEQVYGNCAYTGNMVELFSKTGDFEIIKDPKYLSSNQYVRRGDILLRTSGHTAMVLNPPREPISTPIVTTTQSPQKPEKIDHGTVQAGAGYRCRIIPLASIARIQIYMNTARKTLVQIVKETGADYAINGTLYNIGPWTACENVKVDGVISAFQPNWSDEGFYWTSGADIKYGWVPLQAGNATNYLFGNGLIDSSNNKRQLSWSADLLGARGRTLMGLDGSNNLVLYSCLDGYAPLSPQGAQDKMISLNCIRGAINLDGGSSVGWYDKENQSYQCPGKGTVQNYILIYFKTNNPYLPPTSTLQYGTKGDNVKYVQYALYHRGYGTGSESSFIDGDFGSGTKTAVAKLQATYGLEQNGIVDNKILELL